MLFTYSELKSSKLQKGFEALSVYDYFKAKKIFTKVFLSKQDAYSAYGLAQIFSRADNPFHNLDSACKYVHLSFNAFRLKPVPGKFAAFVLDSTSIMALVDSVSLKQFQRAKKVNTIAAFDLFLKNNYLGNKKTRNEAFYLRDELEYNNVLQSNRSDSTKAFILSHPQSSFYSEALILKDREVFDEMTKNDLAVEYVNFINMQPKNVMLNMAYEKLFSVYRRESDIKGLAFFVKQYPKAAQHLEAWKLLFSLSVKAFSFSELKKFSEEYPEFPLRNSILKELELNKLVLFPYQKTDFTGFIDDNGKLVIEPVYDAASDFFEGLSVVTKNDTVFYVNKENHNPFNKFFSEASVFKNGIAPVKQNGKWFFINRQGQPISEDYDEINELSNSVYVVKSGDKYGALDHYGQTMIEPKFDKLGDFKNEYAYYIENGSYGFVSKSGVVHKAEFDWISDFNDEQIAIVRVNNKYGLVNSTGKRVLQPVYDQIIKTSAPYFIIVQGNSYGFFSSGGCFVCPVIYDYTREKTSEYYTDGRWFKLIKKGEQAMMDENGHIIIDFDSFEEINFSKCGLTRVKRKKKYGFIDRKGNSSIPFKYSEATDFADSVALVKLKKDYKLITVLGKEIFSSESKPLKLSARYFTLGDDLMSIINHQGQLVYGDVNNIQKINGKLYIITLASGEIKLLSD